jgi:hypothetical protein
VREVWNGNAKALRKLGCTNFTEIRNGILI